MDEREQDLCGSCFCRESRFSGPCPRCGSPAEYRSEGLGLSMICPKCGEAVTTICQNCNIDTKIYELEILLGQWQQSPRALLRLAKLLNKNSVEIKRLTDNGETVALQGRLRELVPLARAFPENGPPWRFSPDVVKRFSLFYTCERSLWKTPYCSR